MLCQHPDILTNSLRKMNKITSKNSDKVDSYYTNLSNYRKNNEKFEWTIQDMLYFLQKISSNNEKRNLNSKVYQTLKTISINMHKSLISNLVNKVLEIDPILTQNH